MKFIVPTNSLELGARILSFKITKVTINIKALKLIIEIIDYDFIDENKPSPLPLVFKNPNPSFTLAPSLQS